MLLPVFIIAAVVGLLAYAARDTLRPRVDVWVSPVVAKAADTPAGESSARPSARSQLAQAPGWIEPSPYPVTVPAFVEGVVREVLVLEGDRIEEGQVVARLDDRDARLHSRRVEAELAERQATVERDRAEVAAANFRADELRDEIDRKRPLVATGGIPAGEFTRLELRLRGVEQEIAAARAVLAGAEASVRTARVACEEAALALDRTEIRSPVAGTVLSRHVEPGVRIQLSDKSGGGERAMGVVLRVYNPDKLQVRADVPMADAAKVVPGITALVTTEAIVDMDFEGKVVLVGHEANIQRNTVPVKVLIDKPSAMLKPEMLAKVRFYSASPGGLTEGAARGGSELRLFAADAALFDRAEGKAAVWIIDAGGVAERRTVSTSAAAEGFTLIPEGLRPGDRVVINPPPALRQGSRVRILGEQTTGAVP